MSRFLSNIHDIENFMKAVSKCKHDVLLIKNDNSEQFNLKSNLSEYIAIGRLCEEHGSDYEIFCQSAADESNLLKFFYDKDI